MLRSIILQLRNQLTTKPIAIAVAKLLKMVLMKATINIVRKNALNAAKTTGIIVSDARTVKYVEYGNTVRAMIV